MFFFKWFLKKIVKETYLIPRNNLALMNPNQLTRRQPQKLILMGLGNAGKTSILKTILNEFDSFASLLPTTGVERTRMDFFGRELSIWDFGGQIDYQKMYLSRPVMYFQGIKYLYYVIDAQDDEKVPESIEYFLKVFENTIEYSDDVKVFLFIHKIDPKTPKNVSVKYTSIEENFLSMTVPEMKRHNIEPVIFHTSIFNPMTVISAFSRPLLGNQTIYETLCEAVDSFCWERELPFGIIFLDNLEIGSYYSSSKIFDYVNTKIAKYLDWLDDVEEPPEYKMGKFTITTKQFSILIGENEFTFNLMIGVDPLNIPDEIDELFTSMGEFSDGLEKILLNAEIIRSGELRTENLFTTVDPEERRRQLDELEEMNGLEETDKFHLVERDRELEILDEQYVKVRETTHENSEEEEDTDDVDFEDLED